jgi:hypothetical protein
MCDLASLYFLIRHILLLQLCLRGKSSIGFIAGNKVAHTTVEYMYTYRDIEKPRRTIFLLYPSTVELLPRTIPIRYETCFVIMSNSDLQY